MVQKWMLVVLGSLVLLSPLNVAALVPVPDVARVGAMRDNCAHFQHVVPLRGDLSTLPPPGSGQRYEALIVYGMASLARASLILEQMAGTRWKEIQHHLPFMSDLFLFAEDVVAGATYLKGDESLYFLCTSRGPEATVARAEALCQRLAEAYLGPDF
jgi:hypothetical protein